MCKGADSVIIDRLNEKSKDSEIFHETNNFVKVYAEEGLRTLFLAEKYLDENEYFEW